MCVFVDDAAMKNRKTSSNLFLLEIEARSVAAVIGKTVTNRKSEMLGRDGGTRTQVTSLKSVTASAQKSIKNCLPYKKDVVLYAARNHQGCGRSV